MVFFKTIDMKVSTTASATNVCSVGAIGVVITVITVEVHETAAPQFASFWEMSKDVVA